MNAERFQYEKKELAKYFNVPNDNKFFVLFNDNWYRYGDDKNSPTVQHLGDFPTAMCLPKDYLGSTTSVSDKPPEDFSLNGIKWI